jgi:CRP-like cAMP-binding protein
MAMLAKVPIFAQMSDAFRSAVCQALRPVDYLKGDAVFHQGQDSDWLGILLRGELECHVENSQGTSRKIKGVLPGHTIGDINVLGFTGKRCCTVVAAMPSTLLMLPRQLFKDALATQQDLRAVQCSDMGSELTMDAESFSKLECFEKLGFDSDFASALFSIAERRVLYPGNVVMLEGSSANDMYILEIGEVKVEKDRKHLALLSDGANFGMLAAPGSQNQGTVICTKRCIFSVIPGDALMALLERFPQCRDAVNHAYVKTLVTHGLTDAKVEMTKLDNFYGRVHPLTTEEMIARGIGGHSLVRSHQKSLRLKEKGVPGLPSRPSTARSFLPKRVSSRPCSALAMRTCSPVQLDTRCHSSCE